MMFFANAGIPMIALTLPPMVLLIIPVILIEFWVARKRIVCETNRRKLVSLTVANLLSTFIGWPIAWILCTIASLLVTSGGEAYGLESPFGIFMSVVVQAPWLVPYEEDLIWMIPVAMVVLMIPFFFVSVFSERWILYFFLKNETRQNIRSLTFRANLWSYAFLIIALITAFLSSSTLG
ncbi:MAG: hypothetical protein Q4G68_01310 [Planctomycetia bacterium]|nr:hypothetical protein [Planctomycetia bacterium]